MNEEKRTIVKDHILDRSENGLFHRKGRKVLAVITWGH